MVSKSVHYSLCILLISIHLCKSEYLEFEGDDLYPIRYYPDLVDYPSTEPPSLDTILGKHDYSECASERLFFDSINKL